MLRRPSSSATRACSRTREQQARRLRTCARIVLLPVAAIGAGLSFRSLYTAAIPIFGRYLAAGFPALVDLLILGASLQYVAGAKVGRPMAGWRLTAHAGVFATVTLNALAAEHPSQVPWHITGPAVWAVLVELTAQQVLGDWKATHAVQADRISWTLWLTAPVESARTRLLMLRTAMTDAHTARIAVGVHAATREALRLSGLDRRVRRVIHRQLRAGSLPPVAVLAPLGWVETHRAVPDLRPETILRAVLHGVIDPTEIQNLTEVQSLAEVQNLTDQSPKIPDDRPVGYLDHDGRRPPNRGGRDRSIQQQRLIDAAEVLRRRPAITGPEMRAELAAKGWTLSDRTAARILPAARKEAATPHHPALPSGAPR